MKNLVSIVFCLFTQIQSFSQTKKEPTSFTYAEFKVGYGVSSFGNGLKERYSLGKFSTSGGGLAILAAYHKFKKVNNMVFGIKYKSLGAAPAKGNNKEEMFFNYWGAAVATKYFIFDKDAKKGLYLQADYFFVTQFTQKYRTKANLNFEHQFAIGSGLALGIGYNFSLGKSKTPLSIGVEYETDNRNGEVTGIGKKNFKSSNFGVLLGFIF